MAEEVAPERRDAIEISPAMDIYQIMPFSPLNDARLFTRPLLHLHKRMPEIGPV
jgi:hypothetical protein